MKYWARFLILSFFVSLTAPAQEDPFVDMLNKRRYDRDAILEQFEKSSPSPPVAEEAPAEETEDSGEAVADPPQPSDDKAPGFHLPAFELPVREQSEVDHLSLILPIDVGGISSAVAESFHQGCVKALRRSGTSLRVDLYPTDRRPESTLRAYQQAVTGGADFIVGPLRRPDVDGLLEQFPKAAIPTLLLQPAAGDNYYVLSLDAGTELSQLAKLIQAQNYRVLLVSNKTKFSRRQKRSFEEAWSREVASPVFNFYVYDSDKDWQRLFNRLKTDKEESLENERPPLAVVAAGDGDFIRRTRNFTPSGISVFGSSLFFGERSEGAFIDDLRVMEMPWFVGGIDDDDLSSVRLRPVLQQRFFALGMDACRVVTKFPLWQEGFVFQGMSGDLTLREQIFVRQGVMAQYQAGILKALKP